MRTTTIAAIALAMMWTSCRKDDPKESTGFNCDHWLLARQQQYDSAVHALQVQFPNPDDATQLQFALEMLVINANEDQGEVGCCCLDLD